MKRTGATLVELLVVLLILAILVAILLPILVSSRRRAGQTACISNLHQIDLAIASYAQDNDQQFPFGGDPVDVKTDLWKYNNNGQYWSEAKLLKPLSSVLHSYIKTDAVWRCPEDSGFDSPDATASPPFPANPSSWQQYGSSYYYRTELTLAHLSVAGLVAYDDFPPFAQHGPSEINVLTDGSGKWHATGGTERFNTLMADGHVVNLTQDRLSDAWSLDLVAPNPNP